VSQKRVEKDEFSFVSNHTSASTMCTCTASGPEGSKREELGWANEVCPTGPPRSYNDQPGADLALAAHQGVRASVVPRSLEREFFAASAKDAALLPPLPEELSEDFSGTLVSAAMVPCAHPAHSPGSALRQRCNV